MGRGRDGDKERLGESEVDGREMWIEGERELETGRQTDIQNVLKFVICIGTCNIAFDWAKNKQGISNVTFAIIDVQRAFCMNVKNSCVVNFDLHEEIHEKLCVSMKCENCMAH